MRHFAPLLLCLPILAGCAGESRWINPASPTDRASSDLGICRHEAEDSLGPGAYVPPGDERTSDPMKMVDRARDAKRFEALVGACMAEKGYHRVK